MTPLQVLLLSCTLRARSFPRPTPLSATNLNPTSSPSLCTTRCCSISNVGISLYRRRQRRLHHSCQGTRYVLPSPPLFALLTLRQVESLAILLEQLTSSWAWPTSTSLECTLLGLMARLIGASSLRRTLRDRFSSMLQYVPRLLPRGWLLLTIRLSRPSLHQLPSHQTSLSSSTPICSLSWLLALAPSPLSATPHPRRYDCC